MTMKSASPPPLPRTAGPREWFGLAILLLPTALMTADLGVLWLATPGLTADLQPSSAQLLWTTDIYGFMTAGFLVIMGTLGDRIGRRRMLIVGAIGVIIASLLAAYSTSAEMLIVARGLLGVAGAAVLPSTLSLISHMFADPRQRTRAVAMWVTALSAGIALGPVLGGVLLERFWWGSVFLLGVPVMVVALVLAPLLLPEYRRPDAGRLDLLSVAQFLLGILPIVYGIKAASEGAGAAVVGSATVLGVVFGTLFVRRQRRLVSPLLDLRLFADRTFTVALVMLVFGMMALNGVEYLVPQYLQLVSGLSPLEAALWLVPSGAGLIAGSQLTPMLVRRIRPAYVIAAGAVVAAAGFTMSALAGTGDSGIVLTATGLTVIMFGLAPISVLGTDMAVGSAPPDKAGSAAATGQTAYDLGLALGIAGTGSVAVAVYRDQMAESVPAGVPAESTEAAHDTFGAAVAAADGLPDGLGDALLTGARQAFISGFQAAAVVSGVIALTLAVLVVALLRHISPASAHDAETTPDTVPPEENTHHEHV